MGDGKRQSAGGRWEPGCSGYYKKQAGVSAMSERSAGAGPLGARAACRKTVPRYMRDVAIVMR